MKVYPLALREVRRAAPPHWLQALFLIFCMLLEFTAQPDGNGAHGADSRPVVVLMAAAAGSEGTD